MRPKNAGSKEARGIPIDVQGAGPKPQGGGYRGGFITLLLQDCKDCKTGD